MFKISSPIMDLKDNDIRMIFNMLDIEMPDLYSSLSKLDVGNSKQRTGSLLNSFGTEAIQYIKNIEPELYEKMITKFDGISLYDEFKNNISYRIDKGNIRTWKEYCEILISNMNQHDREKYSFYICDYVSAWIYKGYTVDDYTIECLNYLISLDNDETEKIINDHWNEDSYSIISKENGKNILVIDHCPEKFIEIEAIECGFRKEKIRPNSNAISWEEFCKKITKRRL